MAPWPGWVGGGSSKASSCRPIVDEEEQAGEVLGHPRCQIDRSAAVAPAPQGVLAVTIISVTLSSVVALAAIAAQFGQQRQKVQYERGIAAGPSALPDQSTAMICTGRRSEFAGGSQTHLQHLTAVAAIMSVE